MADAAAHPAAAHLHAAGIELRLVAPENLARIDADREDIVLAGHHVEHAVVHERLRLAGVLRSHAAAVQVRAPHGLQVANVVAIDLLERGVALVGEAAAVGDPAAHGRRRELLRGERGCGLDRRAAASAPRAANDTDQSEGRREAAPGASPMGHVLSILRQPRLLRRHELQQRRLAGLRLGDAALDGRHDLLDRRHALAIAAERFRERRRSRPRCPSPGTFRWPSA